MGTTNIIIAGALLVGLSEIAVAVSGSRNDHTAAIIAGWLLIVIGFVMFLFEVSMQDKRNQLELSKLAAQTRPTEDDSPPPSR